MEEDGDDGRHDPLPGGGGAGEWEGEDEDSDEGEDEEALFVAPIAELFSRLLGHDEELKTLHMDAHRVPEMRAWVDLVFRDPDKLIEAMRTNSAVETVDISFMVDYDFVPGGDFERFYTIIGRAFGALPSLKELDLRCENENDYRAMSILLASIRQITSCDLEVCTAVAPPASVDRALRGHPALESLTVHYSMILEDNDAAAINIFPTCLSTIPNLRMVEFHRDYELVNHLPPLVLDTFGSLPGRLTELSFLGISLDGRGSDMLAQTMATESELSKLTVSDCCFSTGENIETLCEEIGKATSLRSLSIVCPCTSEAYLALAGALRKNRGLSEVELHRRIPYDDANATHILGVHGILAGIKLSDSIRKLSLQYYQWDWLLCEGLNSYLAATTSLRNLTIGSLKLSDTSFRHICASVSATSTLEEFSARRLIVSCQEFLREVPTLKRNKRLESLSIEFCDPDQGSEALLACIPMLGNDSGIKRLQVSSALSVEDGETLLGLLRANFTLTDCQVVIRYGASEEDKERITSQAKTILMLNKRGRKYMLEGKPKAKGVALISAVADDLDCVYFHLLENPSLCCRATEKKSEDASRPLKRPRL